MPRAKKKSKSLTRTIRVPESIWQHCEQERWAMGLDSPGSALIEYAIMGIAAKANSQSPEGLKLLAQWVPDYAIILADGKRK